MEIIERKNGVAVELVNFSELYGRVKDWITALNAFDLTKAEEKERLTQLLYTHYEGETLSVVPSCECGFTTRESNVDVLCPECGTHCRRITERPLISKAWILPPDGVKTFLNPQVWTILSSAMTVSGTNLLEWFCNPMYSLPPEPNRFLRKAMGILQHMRISQGINNFHDHFDEIMGRMFEQGLLYSSGNKRQRQDLMNFIRENRDAIFAPALPIPSRMSFITEKTITRTYGDKTTPIAIDAVLTITSTENSATPLSPRTKQGRAVKANMLLAKYYQEYIGSVLARKPGLFRKHVVGSRLHYTFRAVISSLYGVHHRSELHLPWSMSVKWLDNHLTAKLFQRGFSLNEAATYLADHILKYSDLLAELFEELIEESKLMTKARPAGAPPVLGIPVLLNRNPTLMRGSIQRMYITKIKSDPRINSISMSVLSLKAPNADFDGDALNGMLIMDQEMLDYMDRLAPEMGVMDLGRAWKFSSNIAIPPPQVTTLSSYLNGVPMPEQDVA